MENKKNNKYTLTPLGKMVAFILAAVVMVTVICLLASVTNGSDNKDSSIAQENSVESVDQSSESSVVDETEQQPDIQVSLQKASDIRIHDGITALITDYTKARYTALGNLEMTELDGYFDADSIQGRVYAEFNNATLDYLIYARKNRAADLSFKNAEISISVTDVQSEADGYVIEYYIDDAVSFSFTDTVSYSYNMMMQAKVTRNEEGKFLFTELTEDTDTFLLFEKPVVEAFGYDYSEYDLNQLSFPEEFDGESEIEGVLKALKLQADKDILSQRQSLEGYNANPSSAKETMTADNQYDREKAVAYSYKWISENGPARNPEFTDYAEYGGNCQNYVSQCVLAGGVPMDYMGEYEAQWKWYGEEINVYEEQAGRSGAWAGTEYFYNYCIVNTGFGLVAQTDMNIFAAKPGDVMQYVVDGWTKHSVVVSKIIRDNSGNVVEILVNSNTTDRKDFPLTAYGYTDIRLIRIIGYNN